MPAGQAAPAGTVTLAPSSIMGWVGRRPRSTSTAAPTRRWCGSPPARSLETIEVAPPCVSAIEPLRGWAEDAVADSVDVAVTVVKADRQGVRAARRPRRRIEVSAAVVPGGDRGRGPGPRRAVVFLDLPEAGLYTISVYGLVGGGQGWSADACRKAIVCAPSAPRPRASRSGAR